MGLLLCALLLGAGVGGCTSDGDDPSPLPPAPSQSFSAPSTTATPDPTRTGTGDEVNDGYVLFWQAFINAQVDGNPDLPELVQRAEGQALAFAQESVRAYRTNGWVRVIKEGFSVNSVVVDRGEATARVTDTQDWSKWPLTDRATGQVIDGSTPRQCITADMVRKGEVWAVSRLVFVQNAC
ncbi:hypothetical protein BBK14_13630 [Parafrankia soli]|uniref:Uncharacterized protein n=1 Tax=Parafrankia soli TaxID=2599596 RepID=A0A1S1R193_9ACTN|nr:hypothetical protein BBK14_13630 [Parafrankia soli]